MVLGKIFRKDRKTEPISVFSLRIILSTLFIIVLAGYALFLILDVYNDQPAIISSFTNVNSFPAPMLMLSNIPMKSHFNCYFTYAANNIREENKTCLQYIKQPVLDTTSSNYNGYFQTGGNLLFSTNFNGSLKNIGIMIYIDDATYNTKNLSKTIDVIAIDSELYNTYGPKLFESQNSFFLNSIVKTNTYELSLNQSYNIKVTRNIKKLMTKSWKNYLGFTPDLETIPYFTSTI
ncbi:8271_t:CDS:2, partial [Gigaspora rosea]